MAFVLWDALAFPRAPTGPPPALEHRFIGLPRNSPSPITLIAAATVIAAGPIVVVIPPSWQPLRRSAWRNSCRTAVRKRTWPIRSIPAMLSSDAVLVGAGNPPQGTHGRDRQADFKEPHVDRALLQLRPPDRLSRLGMGSHLDGLWRLAKRRLGSEQVVHGRIQRHLECIADPSPEPWPASREY
jgi:hypothetical protein